MLVAEISFGFVKQAYKVQHRNVCASANGTDIVTNSTDEQQNYATLNSHTTLKRTANTRHKHIQPTHALKMILKQHLNTAPLSKTN